MPRTSELNRMIHQGEVSQTNAYRVDNRRFCGKKVSVVAPNSKISADYNTQRPRAEIDI